ncbi:50S ribosomal protein L3-2 chloroplastic [Bienertia sinuspersici]
MRVTPGVKSERKGKKVGCSHKKPKHLTKPEVGHFRAQGVPLKRKLKEFPVTEDALLPVGTSINVRHFVPGQHVDITGITKGKGLSLKSAPEAGLRQGTLGDGGGCFVESRHWNL